MSTIRMILASVDHYGADLVANTYANLVTQFSPLLYLFSTIYLGFIFLSMQRGRLAPQELPIILLRMACILTLALNYHYFCLFVYDIFTQAPLSLCRAMVMNGDSLAAVPISDALDQFLRQGVLQANKLFNMGSWANLTYWVFGFSVFLTTVLFAALATGLLILAKIASVIILSLSPIFIFFALFDATQGLCESYINQLITYALVPVITCAVLVIILSVVESILQQLDVAEKPSLTTLVPYFLSCLAQIGLLPQIPGKCAALAAGFRLKKVRSMLQEIKNDI